ncbi:flap endonuclease GEN homolog 1 [Pyxicephalus adspersus]|uniref:Flap endonuclease GEN homolog 1 n=1 Tax=Pyxicephalus adspersus TaxID=30357 RepID=A0AAV3AGN7_PYXAD|nr:TPA: hypothetical protein GDO54_010102 [Pyxicephalus adspersus]
MGVHELWPVLEPVKKHVALQSLSGKTLAVDLSIWVCEAQSVKQMIGVVSKPHLRNLFFRVSSLNLMGVKLVFVTEGEAPKLKADTMNKRNAMRYGPSNKPAPSRPGRSYFKSVLKECLRMLDCLGVPWVQAAGEAEAMCAYLNAKGYVDGCITNDGDVFLYGAQTVYRNFTMNVKDPHVDCYKASAIKDKLGLDRESLVALAILLGCDYVPKGLPGVGKEMALKFIRSLNGESVLQRFYQWRKQFDDSTVPTKSAKKTTHCSVCCHPGSAKEHQRKGCTLCGSDRYCEPHDYDYCCPCEWHKAEQEKKNNPLEYTLKTKAKKREGFPYHEVIEEFLVNKDKLSKVIRWARPSLPCFQNFALEWMEWPKHYACEKILVLLTYYDMHERKAGRQHDAQLQATRIVKTRVRNGVPCFEIEWVKPGCYVFPDDHPPDAPLLTIEEESLFTAAYPHIVESFQKDKIEAELLKQKSKKNKPTSKVLPNVDDVASLLSEMSLTLGAEKSPPSQEGVSSVDNDPIPTTSLQSLPDPQAIFLSESSKLPSALLPQETDLSVSTSSLVKKEDTEILHNPCSSPAISSRQESLVSSPNISSLISDLNLSNIDWEATSFSRSPQVESHTASNEGHGSEDKATFPEPRIHALANTKQELVTPSKLKDTADQNPALAVDSPYISHLEKLPLRERILLKNATQTVNLNKDCRPPNLNDKKFPLAPVSKTLDKQKLTKLNFSDKSKDFKENMQIQPKLIKPPSPQKSKAHNNVVTKLTGTSNSSQVLQLPTTKSFSFVKKSILAPMSNIPDCSNVATKPETNPLPKKSVCQKIMLSSDDEDEQVKDGKSKHVAKSITRGTKNMIPQSKMASTTPAFTCLSSDDQSSDKEDIFLSPKSKSSAKAQEDEDDDCDDSIISIDSPLPLSERLKLRLQQNS